MSSSLGSQVLWVSASNALFAACQWLMLVAVARIGGVTATGQFAFALAIVTPVALLANLGLRESFATDAANEFHFSDYLTLRVILVGVTLVAGMLLAFGLRLDWGVIAVFFAAAASKAAESLSDIYYGALQRNRRAVPIAVSRALRGAFGVVAFSVTYLWTDELAIAFLALASAWFLVWALIDRRSVASLDRYSFQLPVDPHRLRRLAYISAPLGVALFLASLKTNIPRLIVERLQSDEALGLFASFSYLFIMLGLIVNAASLVASSSLADSARDADAHRYWRISLSLLSMSILLGIVGILAMATFGEEIVTLVYGAGFAKSLDLLVAISGVALIAYVTTVANCMLNAFRDFRSQLYLSAASMAVAGIGCFVLIQKFGLIGAAAGWAAGLIVHLAGALARVFMHFGGIRQ